MSKKDKYGLKFLKLTTDGNVGYNCIRKDGIVDKNNLLQFLSYLNISLTEFLLKEINDYIHNTKAPDYTPYDSMVLEHMDLKIHYPEFIIDDQPDTFPLADIRDLLQEWLVFLKS
ncbi:hypothetical protein [Chryseobacterium luteum]|uniref:Uncharacterized protein n=1 Tax=Chryseobacterium luteum TaxID=421531 RepID=A0A085YZG8_9FLAO|nr:hypothetical protein [Chryseobacterium luteum]KFE97581.1 hypothetical protein IX38_20105 [Chryseobacterium luteum]